MAKKAKKKAVPKKRVGEKKKAVPKEKVGEKKKAVPKEKVGEKKKAGFDSRIAVVAIVVVAVIAIGAVLLMQPKPSDGGGVVPPLGSGIKTFKATSSQLDLVDGKPVVRLFSTTWCPHCKWVKETFDSAMKQYAAEGKIIAYHWEVDTSDNTLTDAVETAVPESEMAIFRANGGGSVPTFVFGGKYVRVGNGFESQNPSDAANPESDLSKQHLEQEKQEYAAVIAQLLKEIAG